jgi:hypothetical protein
MSHHVKKKNTSMRRKTMVNKYAEQTTVKQQETTLSPKVKHLNMETTKSGT